jgi:hypothetical protein
VIVEFVVAAGKKEHARSWARIEGDAVAAQGSGAADEPADVTFTATPGDADALHSGSLDLSVAFMRGQVKMAGDFGAVLHFLPLTAGEHSAVSTAALLPG